MGIGNQLINLLQDILPESNQRPSAIGELPSTRESRLPAVPRLRQQPVRGHRGYTLPQDFKGGGSTVFH